MRAPYSPVRLIYGKNSKIGHSLRTLNKKNSRDTWTGNELKKLALICTAH